MFSLSNCIHYHCMVTFSSYITSSVMLDYLKFEKLTEYQLSLQTSFFQKDVSTSRIIRIRNRVFILLGGYFEIVLHMNFLFQDAVDNRSNNHLMVRCFIIVNDR